MLCKMLDILLKNPITHLQYAELGFNQFVQEHLHSAQPLWLSMSEQFSAAQLIDVYVPLVGFFHHQLLVRLVCSLAVINTLNSLIKWCSPEYRPYWFAHELSSHSMYKSHNTSLQQYSQTCETTAGFPSSHTMAFTTFVYLVVVYSCTYNRRRWGCEHYLNLICHIIVITLSACMWLSRIYLGTQFVHQCILASMAAIIMLHLFDQYSEFLYTLCKSEAVSLVVAFGILPLIVYFAMQRMNIDPHWSVRMAFKWCSDPSYLRHEASPIFVLGRDFGYLMGVALSTPLYKRYESHPSLVKRIPVFVIVELVNYYARQETPKHRGRFIFVAYEFGRNMLHSYTLLTILSKIN